MLPLVACATAVPDSKEAPSKDHESLVDDESGEDPVDPDPENPDDDPPGDTPDNPDDDPPEIPEGDDEIEGAWTTVDELMTEDHCNMEDYVLAGTGQQLILDVVGEGALELTDSRGVNYCTYDEISFDCDSRVIEDHTPSTDFGLSAVILLDTAAYGTFEADDRMYMQTDIVANCSGSDCWMVELATASFPCEMRHWVAAEAE
jgi:hypothetical protein